MPPLTNRYKIIRNAVKASTGLTMKQFAEEKIGGNYLSFAYRVRKAALKLSDYHTIMFYTGMGFEELWPNPLAPAPISKITLNLAPSKSIFVSPNTPQPENNGSPPVKSKPKLPPQEKAVVEVPKKKPEVITPPADFTDIVDPYGGAIPLD